MLLWLFLLAVKRSLPSVVSKQVVEPKIQSSSSDFPHHRCRPERHHFVWVLQIQSIGVFLLQDRRSAQPAARRRIWRTMLLPEKQHIPTLLSLHSNVCSLQWSTDKNESNCKKLRENFKLTQCAASSHSKVHYKMRWQSNNSIKKILGGGICAKTGGYKIIQFKTIIFTDKENTAGNLQPRMWSGHTVNTLNTLKIHK